MPIYAGCLHIAKLVVLSAGFAAATLCGFAQQTAQSPWALRNQRIGGDDLWGIASGPSGLVAVGTNGAILQSPDGQTWTRRTSGTTDWLTAITYGNGRYVAVGDHGHILASTDGTTWTNVLQSATTQRLNNVLFAQNKFVAVGESGTILLSNDGVTWTASASGTTNWLRGLAWGQSMAADYFGSIQRWIATGQAGSILTSADGIAWTVRSSGVTTDLEAATFIAAFFYVGSGTPIEDLVFAAVGQGGTVQLLTLGGVEGYPNLPGYPIPPIQIQSTPIALNPGARFRCLLSGAHYFFSISQAVPNISRAEQAPPVIAIDESGNVFTAHAVAHSDDSNFTNSDPTQAPITEPTSWARDTLSSTAVIRAAVYDAAQESFYAVGENETIFQRDQVFNGRLGNLSTRGFVDQGEKALAAGFIVRGSTPKPMLVRGVGPALSNFGLTGVLAQPVLTVYDSVSHVIAINSGWASNADQASIANAATRAGAFPLTSGSGDSALRLTLAPGLYTAQVSGATGTSGLALVEIYDLDDRVSGYARAINLSTRGLVGSGANVLIAGLSVQGPAWRTFLVRGVGPSLAKFGIANVLADPALSLTLQRPITTASPNTYFVSPNRDPAAISAASNAVGAFAFDAGSQDDALIVSLPPGTYTFQISSKSNSTGIALIEIYEIGIAH